MTYKMSQKLKLKKTLEFGKKNKLGVLNTI